MNTLPPTEADKKVAEIVRGQAVPAPSAPVEAAA